VLITDEKLENRLIMGENKIFRVDDSGRWTVWPNSKVKLPGYFLNELQAERAYRKYKATPKLRRRRSIVQKQNESVS